MKRASITEAKNQLSALLDRVRGGETVIIEDRGRPIARLESVLSGGPVDPEGRLARLERAGLARRPASPLSQRLLTTAPPKSRASVRASDFVIAERRDER